MRSVLFHMLGLTLRMASVLLAGVMRLLSAEAALERRDEHAKG
jgi:hypothetical protein